MELKQILILFILSALLIVGHARTSYEDKREMREDENAVEKNADAEEEADGAQGGESGASGSASGSGTEPTPAPPAPGGSTPIPIGDAVNQVCAGFQSCVAQADPAICLKQMVNALSSLVPAPAAGGVPVGGAPCQGGGASPMPMPMPMPQPMPYPVQPSSCGGTYPCGDKASESKGKKHHDKKEKRHHKED